VKLYYVPKTRSTRPRWLLEELGIPYELVRVDVAARENRTAGYLALNPLGHVPTLVDGDTVIYESLAICLYLADRFPDKGLAPHASSPGRGAYLAWMVFAVVTVERVVEQAFDHTVRLPEADRLPRLADEARARFLDIATVLDGALAGRDYLVGDRFSAADLLMGSVLSWGRTIGLLAEQPRLDAYTQGLIARPAARRSRAD
jgi:glutathione S-transferase